MTAELHLQHRPDAIEFISGWHVFAEGAHGRRHCRKRLTGATRIELRTDGEHADIGGTVVRCTDITRDAGLAYQLR